MEFETIRIIFPGKSSIVSSVRKVNRVAKTLTLQFEQFQAILLLNGSCDETHFLRVITCLKYLVYPLKPGIYDRSAIVNAWF
jgi:hypothetical protein